ncbi:hypothetical protein MYCTH_112362 [Thermothelomyces thermophilus ATCC 42464]|uniref:RGS domain-containing protein n=1 Tax=Thermothelomyces thermophilus (strain ATCC 42464 / BCRC 31852 / DSM 1799) TaxID=573729 RepID=G2QII4_THET4|nr:uncharacterized protein MYCTH_112362 [Thermothelomyces thermophilus ATCC 42464]AEO59516.1 hypothetical protein MYCTH_112362 [Thermothelomyces thermophilus ATCC 42464]
MILPRASETPAPAAVGSEFGTTPDTKPEPRLDGVGIWWITFGAVWTALLVCGMTFLYKKRNTPTLRLRSLSLTFSGIILLHLYWISVQIAYSVGPLAPEVAEYWIMGVWYPFGIALFHAGNSQFLHVAKAQSRFARPPSQMKTRYDEKRLVRRPNLFQAIMQMDYSKRMFMFVTMGMTVQLLVVVIIYLISRKFHSDFGIPGTEVTGSSPAEIAMKQGRGWEWWPSIVWQFVWAWIIAPIILWRSRGIHDTHGWQRQTIACCIAGLPAAPMWLIALYVPGMAPVNKYFVPPQWIALTIMVMEIWTVFVPCWEIHKHQTLRQETLESIANWESKKRLGTKSETSSDRSGGPPLSPTSTKVGDSGGFDSWKKLSNLESNSSQSNLGPDESVLTMAALEHVLEKNPEPLRQFSARKDFSGENIAFLTAVSEWKNGLPADFVRGRFDASPDAVRDQFTRALRIYTEFISPREAEFPINIAWADLRKLQGVFERAARSLAAANPSSPVNHADAATPFADDNFVSTPAAAAAAGAAAMKTPADTAAPNKAPPSRDSQVHILDPPGPEPEAESEPARRTPPTSSRGNNHIPLTVKIVTPPPTATPPPPPPYPVYEGDIPEAFDATVFDAAQASIKYLVLTNTWPKYVRERRGSESGSSSGAPSERGGGSAPSTLGGGSVRSKISLKSALGFLKGVIH